MLIRVRWLWSISFLILRSDSSAALGIIGRRGFGKVRHIEIGYLWLQDVVSMKRLSVRKVKGVDNPADLGTKHLKSEDIAKHLKFLGFHFQGGRTTAVPSIHKDSNSSSGILSMCVVKRHVGSVLRADVYLPCPVLRL